MLPVPISLQSFAIEDGRFFYHDARSKQYLVIDDIDDKITFSIDKDLKNITSNGDLSLAQVSLKTAELTKPLTNLIITLHHDVGADLQAGNAQIKSLRLSLQKVFLTLTGTISDLNTVPKIDCNLTSDAIALQDLLKEIPVELAPVLGKIAAAGELLVGLKLKGTFEKNAPLPIMGTVSIKNGMFKYADLPKSVNQINLQCAFTDNSLDIASLKLYFGDNPVALQAKVNNFKKPNIDLNLRADMNLENVKDFAKLPDGASLSGRINADVNAKGEADPSDPSKIAVQGKLDLTNVTALWPPLTKPAVINGGLTISSQAIGNAMSIAIGRSKVAMNANIKNYLSFVFPDSTKKLPRPDAGFTITSSLLDVDEFLPPQEKKDTTTVQKKEERGGPLIAPLPGVDVRGRVTAKSVMYNKIPMNDVVITVNVINDIADVVVKTGFAGGTIAENLHADVKNVNNVNFNNNLTIKDVEINDVMTNFGGFLKPTTALNRELVNLPKSLLGKINLSSAFNGNGGNADELVNSLTGDIGLKMVDGTITNSTIVDRLSGTAEKFLKLNNKEIRFKDLSTALHIAEKSVVIDNLKFLSAAAGDWNVKGNVGFDTKLDIAISNRLTKDVSAQLLRVQSSGKNLVKGLLQGTQFAQASDLIDNANIGIPADQDGRVTLLFGLSGTATDPKTSFAGFGKGSTASQEQPMNSAKTQVLSKISDKVDQAKVEAQKRLDEERMKAEAQLAEERKKAEALMQQKAEEQKQAIQGKKENVEQQLKKTAADKLKKLF